MENPYALKWALRQKFKEVYTKEEQREKDILILTIMNLLADIAKRFKSIPSERHWLNYRWYPSLACLKRSTMGELRVTLKDYTRCQKERMRKQRELCGCIPRFYWDTSRLEFCFDEKLESIKKAGGKVLKKIGEKIF